MAAITELENAFQESPDLLVLDTRGIADPAVIETIRTVKQIGQEQFEEYSDHCLTDKSTIIGKPMKRNKLTLFGSHRNPELAKSCEE